MRSLTWVFAVLLLTPILTAPAVARTAGACPHTRAEFEIGALEAFEHPIDDRDLLLLVNHMTYQEGIFTKPFHLVPDAGPVSLPPPTGHDPACRLPQVPYAVARTVQMAMMKWKLRPEQLDALVPRLESAFEALARRDELESRTIDAALRPFGVTIAEYRKPLDPSDACDGLGAHNTDVNVGFLTWNDHVHRTAHLRVEVDLTADALVRDVKILSNSAAGTPYEDAFAESTLDTGAAAPYVTDCTGGHPRATSFFYSADYK